MILLNPRSIELTAVLVDKPAYFRNTSAMRVAFVAVIKDVDGSAIALVLGSGTYKACCRVRDAGQERARKMDLYAVNPERIPDYALPEQYVGVYGQSMLDQLRYAIDQTPVN
jgi:hypothetical protein